MINDLGPSLVGFVLYNSSDHELSIDPILEKQPGDKAALAYVGLHRNLRTWHELVVRTSFPIDRDQTPSNGVYSSRFIVIPGYSKLVVLSGRKVISKYVIKNVIQKRFREQMMNVPFFIDRILDECDNDTSEFVVTSLVGRRGPNATDVRTMSLYGPDVLASDAFRKQRKHFSFTLCGLKHRQVGRAWPEPSEDDDLPFSGGEREVLRVGNDGFVSTYVSSALRAKEFKRTIGLLTREPFVPSDIPVPPTGR